jgi:hypothetical protein
MLRAEGHIGTPDAALRIAEGEAYLDAEFTSTYETL